MPKLKTHKGAQKRFHLTGGNKLLRFKQGKSHLRRKKSPSVKRLYHAKVPVHPTVRKRIKSLIPYLAS